MSGSISGLGRFTFSKVDNVNKIVKNFDRLIDKEDRRINKKVMKIAMKPVAATAKSLVPVKSGILRKSIKSGVTGTGNGLIFIDSRAIGENGTPAAKYGAVLEFGSSTIPQRSFMRAAMDKHRSSILSNFETIWKQEIKQLRFNI